MIETEDLAEALPGFDGLARRVLRQARLDAMQIVPLRIPVPPQLEEAIGYRGQARNLGVYWEPEADEPMWADGRLVAVAHWEAYLTFIDHLVVVSSLGPYELGRTGVEPKHCLLIDRTHRNAFAAPVSIAQQFLYAQWPDPPFETVSPELRATIRQLGLEAILEGTVSLADDVLPESNAPKRAIVRDMLDWLDSQIPEALAREQGLPVAIRE